MGLTRTPEQEALQQSVRHRLDLGQDPGLRDLLVPERHGGRGLGPTELGVALEELGGALVEGPHFATVALGVQALLAAAEPEAQAHWLPRIAGGSATATLAVSEDSGAWEPLGGRTRAEPVRGQWLLSGGKSFVHDGAADLLLVVADSEDGIAVFAVEGSAAGVQRTSLPLLDPSRPLARVRFDEVPAERVSGHGDARDDIARALRLAVVALAAEQVGGAQRCLDLTVEHVRTRVQFGHPVGAFQAVKAQCAELLLVVESARSAMAYAASVAEDTGPEAAVAACVAGSVCSLAYTRAAKTAIQLHGGLGFTWEHEAHRHLRRAKSSELLLGTPVRHRERLAELLLIGGRR